MNNPPKHHIINITMENQYIINYNTNNLENPKTTPAILTYTSHTKLNKTNKPYREATITHENMTETKGTTTIGPITLQNKQITTTLWKTTAPAHPRNPINLLK